MTDPAGLRISDGLVLPIEFVTKTAAIISQRRKGKTYTASVIAEEFVAAQIPFVALDPTGAWWGLLAAANGIDAGLPVVVIGGQHGQLPLDPAGGRFIADLVLDRPGFYVLDLSLLGTRAAERAFAYAFADRLYRRKMQVGMDFPLHLFVDEADMFVPQEREAGDNLMLGAFQAIVRRGGLHGLGTTLITQRPALVNKNVLTQLDVLILLRLVAGNDQDYLDKNYVKRAGTASERDALMGSLTSLALGEAWIWEPGADPPLFERVQIRERRTFNSSATPKPGETRVEPIALAEVDLASIKEAMAATIEKAQAEDPKALRSRIRALEHQLAGQLVESQRRLSLINLVLSRLDEIQGLVMAASGDLDHARSLDHEPPAAAKEGGAVQPGPSAARSSPAPGNRTVPGTAITEEKKPAAPAGDAPRGPAGLNRAETAVLTAVLQLPGRPAPVVGFLSGYGATSKSFRNAVGSLRSKGLLARGLPLTPLEGAEAALIEFEPLPTGQELREWWLGRLGGAERRLLSVLLGAYPASLTREEVARLLDWPADSKTLANAVGRLRSLGLCVRGEFRATDELVEALAG